VAVGHAVFVGDGFAVDIAQLAKPLSEVFPDGRIVDDPDTQTLAGERLSVGGRWKHHPADEQRQKRTALHSMTSSARSSTASEIFRPIALAVFRLIASSNRCGVCTGRSAGLTPRRILSVKKAACLNMSGKLAP